jgi:hypothetical protein
MLRLVGDMYLMEIIRKRGKPCNAASRRRYVLDGDNRERGKPFHAESRKR